MVSAVELYIIILRGVQFTVLIVCVHKHTITYITHLHEYKAKQTRKYLPEQVQSSASTSSAGARHGAAEPTDLTRPVNTTTKQCQPLHRVTSSVTATVLLTETFGPSELRLERHPHGAVRGLAQLSHLRYSTRDRRLRLISFACLIHPFGRS